jgi:hypothetical protein
MDSEEIYRILKVGTPEDRQDFARGLPPGPFKDMAAMLLSTDRPGMVIVALGPSIIGYCNGGEPDIGAALAKAAHRYAVELYTGTPDHGLIPTTLSGLAHSFAKASNQLGRSQEVIDFTDQYIPFYEQMGETANLPSLKLERISALMNLNRLDEAEEALNDPTLAGNPASDIELERQRGVMRRLRTPVFADRSQSAPAAGPVGDDFVARAKDAMKKVIGGSPEDEQLKALIDNLTEAPRSDPSDPAGFEQLLKALEMGEDFLRRGGSAESELSVRGRVRKASAIFVQQKQPDPEEIRKSLTELEQSLDWAHDNGIVDLENDALYGMYLCHGRLKDPSSAADALLQLRANLEAARSAITDVEERGGAFSVYPHLFPALCEKLHAAGRVPEMFEAIEASKGRGVADLLTRKSGRPVSDVTIYRAVARVPELCRRHNFSYVSYLVDDEQTYVVLVTGDGRVQAPALVVLSRAAIRAAANPVTPASAQVLAPLVAWLAPFLADGTVKASGHLCIAADDDLVNVPFGLLPLKGRPLTETLSTSRIHNAYHLEHLLETDPRRPEEYLGVVVPNRQNVASDEWDKMHADLLKPIDFLATALSGETLEGPSVSPDAVASHKLAGQVLHFSTHGTFPESQPPFDYSGLILADGHALPDGEQEADTRTMLTPRKVLADKLDLTGSHVSMMACVSGLSREGVGGDALGLEWAMIQAGAASVLSSHWKVSAESAGTFLRMFYEEWLGHNRSRSEALSTTVASLRARGGRAGAKQSWAAFSLTGDWR